MLSNKWLNVVWHAAAYVCHVRCPTIIFTPCLLSKRDIKQLFVSMSGKITSAQRNIPNLLDENRLIHWKIPPVRARRQGFYKFMSHVQL